MKWKKLKASTKMSWMMKWEEEGTCLCALIFSVQDRISFTALHTKVRNNQILSHIYIVKKCGNVYTGQYCYAFNNILD